MFSAKLFSCYAALIVIFLCKTAQASYTDYLLGNLADTLEDIKHRVVSIENDLKQDLKKIKSDVNTMIEAYDENNQLSDLKEDVKRIQLDVNTLREAYEENNQLSETKLGNIMERLDGISLTRNETSVTIDIQDVCNSNTGSGTIPAIVNGVDVSPPRKYPWHVGLFNGVNYSGKFFCGGSIINNRWILTAGHCTFYKRKQPDGTWKCVSIPFTKLQVRVGEHRRSTTNDNDPVNTKNYVVKRVVEHNIYRQECPRLDYDFSLLELESEIPFNSVIRPVDLPIDGSKTYAGVNGVITGWGITEDMDLDSLADILQEAEVPILAQSDCEGWGRVKDIKLCAGPYNGKAVCNGDSGGALVVKEGNKYIQVGVASYTFTICDNPHYSNIYGRVSKVLDWIRETITS